MLRRLPFVMEPLPDEPLIPWLETMAHAYRASFGQILTAVGLIGADASLGDQLYRGGMTSTWAACLRADQAGRVAFTTGLTTERLASMTRTVWAASVTRLTRENKVAVCSPAAGATGRYCPDCLSETGGRWRMHWGFHFGFACLTHDRLLVDSCPVCGLDARRGSHPLRLAPVPGRCHNPGGGKDAPQRCGGSLTSREGDEADGALLTSQREILELVSTDRRDTGIYRELPQSAAIVMKDVRLLARLSLGTLDARQLTGSIVVGEDTLAEVRRQVREPPRVRAALVEAVGSALALDALGDRERVTELLRGRLATSTSYAQHSPQMQELIAGAFGRTRRPAAILQSGAGELSPAELAARLPAVMWPEWARVLAPQRAHSEIAAVALSAVAMLAGARLTRAAALELLDPGVKPSQVTLILRQVREPIALTAMRSLTAYLDDHASPIDYARRRALDYSEVLSGDEWLGVAEQFGVSPGGRRRLQFARVHLYREISGNRTSTAPAKYRLQTAPDRSCFSAFEASLPPEVGEALSGLGAAFLDRHGITEPATWSPPVPFGAAAARAASSETATGSWPAARPAARAMMSGLTPEQAIAQYASGRSLRDLAADTGVARQTVGRVLRQAGGIIRPAHAQRRIVIGDEWLREQYEIYLRTIGDIAKEVGAGRTTVARRLRGAGATIRERGGASHAQVLLHDAGRRGSSPR